jgi:tryptophanyl-tRNA synthetase
MAENKKQVVLSGIRATGRLHLGNFLGALRNFARYSNDSQYNCFFFVADWHTITTLTDTAQIRQFLPEIILDYLAAGVDHEKSTIFVQSGIPETAELFWILSCLTQKAELERVPSFKDKALKHAENVNAGLFNYPVLMAADILGPQADLVPVGKDQEPHLEMAKEVARKFNRLYGDTFAVPHAMSETMIIVPGLDGTGKMGKSEGNTINLDDTEEAVRAKIKIAVTDPARQRRTDPGSPSKCNVYTLHTMLSSDDELKYCADGCTSASIGCAECKTILANNVIALLKPFQERRLVLSEKKDLVSEVLHAGQIVARQTISKTVETVREKIGLQRF